MKLGYARVSTDDQNLDLQRDTLAAAGCDRIFEEKASGAKADRPAMADALNYARPGDTIVVWRLDRLGRSLADLVRIINDLKSKGIGFESVTEKIDTTTATGKLVFHIFGALAEFERALIQERTAAGLAAARARGRKGGRPRVSPDKVNAAVKMYLEQTETPPAKICKIFGISETTLYKYAKETKQAMALTATAISGDNPDPGKRPER